LDIVRGQPFLAGVNPPGPTGKCNLDSVEDQTRVRMNVNRIETSRTHRDKQQLKTVINDDVVFGCGINQSLKFSDVRKVIGTIQTA